MNRTLHILLTNHHLMSYHGSENFTFTIADFLRRKGHQVTVYSAYVGKLKSDFERLGIRVVSDLRLLKDQDFDLAHVHHSINACEIRFYFPHLPIVLLCHGIIFLENPPPVDLNISQYLATSERVRDCMAAKGVPLEKILIFRNMVDSEKFYPYSQINLSPRRAVILSNKIDSKSENVIRQACKSLRIKSVFLGERFRRIEYKQIPLLLNQADIVFSLGRGVIEAMLCGRIPVVFDFEGGDGIVTPASIMQNMRCNFSGNLHNAHYTLDELICLLNEYKAEDAMQLRCIALEHFSANRQIDRLIDIYYRHVNKKIESLSPINNQILASIVSSIAETRYYSGLKHRSSQPFPFLYNAAKSLYMSTGKLRNCLQQWF